MIRDFEEELFNLIHNDEFKLTKEDISEYLDRKDINISRGIFRLGADLENSDPDYIICEAAMNCSYEIVEALVIKGAKLDIFEDEESFNPIIWAAIFERTDVIQLFIDNGADLLIKDYHGRTALVNAVLNDHVSSTKLILENYDDSGEADLDKSYALFVAVKNSNDGVRANSCEIAKLLLDNGTNPNIKHGDDEITPLHLAATKPLDKDVNMEMVNLLIDYKAEIRANKDSNIEYKSSEKIVSDILLQRVIEQEIKENSAQVTAIKKAMAGKPKIEGLKI